MSIKEVREECYSCGNKVDSDHRTCIDCGEALCDLCDCPCQMDRDITVFEDDEEDDTITKLDMTKQTKEVNPLYKNTLEKDLPIESIKPNTPIILLENGSWLTKEAYDLMNRKPEEYGLIGGADLNLYEVGTMIENISLDYYSTDPIDLETKGRLYKQYVSLAKHYNKIMGATVITEAL